MKSSILRHVYLGFILVVVLPFLSACATTKVGLKHSSLDLTFLRINAVDPEPSNHSVDTVVFKDLKAYSFCDFSPNIILNETYFIGGECYVKPEYRNNLPEQIVITYAVLPDSAHTYSSTGTCDRPECEQATATLTNKYYGKLHIDLISKKPHKVYKYYDANGREVSEEKYKELGKQNIIKTLQKLPDNAWKTYVINTKDVLAQYQYKKDYLSGHAMFSYDRDLELGIGIYHSEKEGLEINVSGNTRWKNKSLSHKIYENILESVH